MRTWRLGVAIVLAFLLGVIMFGCAAPITRPGTRGCVEGDDVALQEKDGPVRCVCVGGEWQGPPICDTLNTDD